MRGKNAFAVDLRSQCMGESDHKVRHQCLEEPKEEDINTMHRYRDAIVYDMNRNASVSNGVGRNTMDVGEGAEDGFPDLFDRTMFGAYVLFPYSDQE